MLAHVGWGVAMANANDEVKTVADAVCGDVADAGVPRYLHHMGFSHRVFTHKRPDRGVGRCGFGEYVKLFVYGVWL